VECDFEGEPEREGLVSTMSRLEHEVEGEWDMLGLREWDDDGCVWDHEEGEGELGK